MCKFQCTTELLASEWSDGQATSVMQPVSTSLERRCRGLLAAAADDDGDGGGDGDSDGDATDAVPEAERLTSENSNRVRKLNNAPLADKTSPACSLAALNNVITNTAGRGGRGEDTGIV